MLGAARLCCRQGLCDMVSRWFLTLACRWSVLPGPAAVKLPGGGPTSHALPAPGCSGLRAPGPAGLAAIAGRCLQVRV